MCRQYSWQSWPSARHWAWSWPRTDRRRGTWSVVARHGEIELECIRLGPSNGHLQQAERIPFVIAVQAEAHAGRNVHVGDVTLSAQNVGHGCDADVSHEFLEDRCVLGCEVATD